MKLSWRVCLGVKDVKKKGELERFVWWFRKVSGGGTSMQINNTG